MGIMKSAGTQPTTKTLLPNKHIQRLLQVPLVILHSHSRDTLPYSQPATSTKWQWGTTETAQAIHTLNLTSADHKYHKNPTHYYLSCK